MKNLTTDRLKLRSFIQEDFEDLSILMSDPEVMKFTGYREVKNQKFIQKELERWIKETEFGNNYWCIREKNSDIFVGWAMLKKTISEYFELGFMLTQSQWHKGYATEAARSILKFAKDDLNQQQVIASTRVENLTSQKIMTKLNAKVSSNYISEPDIIYYEINLKDF